MLSETSRARFFRVTLILLFAVGLVVGGCDLFRSDSSPAWSGDWEVTNFAGESLRSDTYYTFTRDTFTLVRDQQDGCGIFQFEIVNAEGNEVTFKFGDELQTERLEVSGDMLTGTIIRSNDTDLEGETYEAVSVDADPKELVGDGCQQSTIKSGAAHPFR